MTSTLATCITDTSDMSLVPYKKQSQILNQPRLQAYAKLAAKGKTKAQTGKLYYGKKMSGTMMQAVRTGGWGAPGMGGELKYVDVDGTIAQSIGNTAVWTNLGLLNGLSQGTTASQRVGRKVNMKSYYIRWGINPQITSIQSFAVRFLCIYDKQANASAPNISDILEGNGGAPTFFAPNNLSNRDRFITLADWTTPVITGPAGSTATNASVGAPAKAFGDWYKRLSLEVMFNGTNGGTIGDITSGSVYLFACEYGVATANVQVAFYSRIRYTDV